MNKTPLWALALALAAGPLLAAQLYRWVDEKGNVEWRDTPPPSTAKKVEQRNMGGQTIETSTMPYSLQQAVKNFPVTLWISDCGEPCTKARGHLARRGVPYSERNAEKENDALKKLMGSAYVPVLIVGSNTVKGYLDTDWDAALDAAGYPRTALPGMKQPVPPAASKAGGESPSKSTTAGTSKTPAPAAAR